LAKQLNIPHIDIRFVEAEPQHLQWIGEEIAVNRLNDIKTTVIGAAISYSDKQVPFAVDLREENLDAHSWYGQMIVTWEQAPVTEETYFGKRIYRRPGGFGQIYVDTTTLEAVTGDVDRIDLIDMDLQGAEQELIENSIATLSTKARLLHIGTHSVEIENTIRKLLRHEGWICRWDFSLRAEHETPYGTVMFDDGVQGWINPRLL